MKTFQKHARRWHNYEEELMKTLQGGKCEKELMKTLTGGKYEEELMKTLAGGN